MSTASINQALENQMKNLEAQTGRKIEEWLSIVRTSPLQKHGELVNMLKTEYGIGHGYANMLVHQAKASFAGAAGDDTDWVAEQYRGKELLKPWYDRLVQIIGAFGPDVEISPKKAYVSVRRKKQFALLQPSTKGRLDIGLNLKGVEAQGALEKAGSWNAMCTHRVRIESDTALSPELESWLKQAYEQAG